MNLFQKVDSTFLVLGLFGGRQCFCLACQWYKDILQLGLDPCFYFRCNVCTTWFVDLCVLQDVLDHV